MGEMTLGAADEELLNSMTGLASALAANGAPFEMFGLFGDQLSQADTLYKNNRWYLVSNLRQLLTQLYVEHGIVQTLVDQPVDDSFRAGFELKSGSIDDDDMEQLKIYDERHQVIGKLIQAIKWARLYGGGAVLIITDQNPAEPLNIKAITPDTPLEFRSVDMWELFTHQNNVVGSAVIGGQLGEPIGEFYDYYGIPVHKSRVYRIAGKECPSFLRPRLRGWGMSELERLVRSLNQYLKNQDVIFSLLDEAKVDVYRVKGFNNALLTPAGTQNIQKKIQVANQLKSFNNALTMDAQDEYEQKQIAFAGLAEVLLQIRQGIAADLKMPMTKLFGISAAGFSSGEDDIENYNSMLESEIRKKVRFMVVDLYQIIAQKVLGIQIPDLMIDFNPLRILNAKEEEEVKDSQFARTVTAYTSGLMQDKEAKKALNKDSLLPIEVDVNVAAAPPLGMADDGDEPEAKPAKGSAGKQAPKEA